MECNAFHHSKVYHVKCEVGHIFNLVTKYHYVQKGLIHKESTNDCVIKQKFAFMCLLWMSCLSFHVILGHQSPSIVMISIKKTYTWLRSLLLDLEKLCQKIRLEHFKLFSS